MERKKKQTYCLVCRDYTKSIITQKYLEIDKIDI